MDCDKGPDTDREGFTALLRELRKAFTEDNLLLSTSVPSNKDIIDRGNHHEPIVNNRQ